MTDCNARQDEWASLSGFALHHRDTIAPEEVRLAEVTYANGHSALDNLELCARNGTDGVIDAITFGPFNKAALIELALAMRMSFITWQSLGVETYISELNTLNGIWTSRVSSHSLKDVSSFITEHRITEAAHLIDRTLRRSCLARPRLSVAALNPHAGETMAISAWRRLK